MAAITGVHKLIKSSSELFAARDVLYLYLTNFLFNGLSVNSSKISPTIAIKKNRDLRFCKNSKLSSSDLILFSLFFICALTFSIALEMVYAHKICWAFDS